MNERRHTAAELSNYDNAKLMYEAIRQLTDEDRRLAMSYISRKGHADLVAMLGLV